MSHLVLVASNELDNTIDPTAFTGLDRVQIASILLGVFLPLLVGLVTKYSTKPSVKAILLLALSAASGFLTEMVNDENFMWQQALITTVLTFVVGVAMQRGLWVPTGASAAVTNTLIKDPQPQEPPAAA